MKEKRDVLSLHEVRRFARHYARSRRLPLIDLSRAEVRREAFRRWGLPIAIVPPDRLPFGRSAALFTDDYGNPEAVGCPAIPRKEISNV